MPANPVFSSARRSLRLWPIEGVTEKQLWENVGEFLHGTLGIPETDLCQGDNEEVVWLGNKGMSDQVSNDTFVKFFDKRKRDIVMSSSPMLASSVDHFPPALYRFGARWRAQHGEGTRRHIKFNDYARSLFTNINCLVMLHG